MDGNGTLFGTLNGSTRQILQKMSVDLPNKHGRGGQSALRFARLRLEKRANYVTKVAETALKLFVENNVVNVSGLVVAGSADFKTFLVESDKFDPRLASKVVKVVDVAYGGENGFNQAIELSSAALGSIRFIQEKKVVEKFFEEVAQDTGKVCFGLDDSLRCMESGAVEKMLVWENLQQIRFVLRNTSSGEEQTLLLSPEQAKNPSNFWDKDKNCELEVLDQMELIEWLSTNYEKFGCKLELVTDRSQEGNQFCRGFGGIGGFLRYRCEFLDHSPFEGLGDDEEAGARVSDDDYDWEDLGKEDFM
mmetsp:Transcript_27200/g.55482  ORF Transcript_27200/g.55482 Transcript_27200/m.55482 type:complete len:305 (-) Transcript_27200:163-1077(-)